MFPRIMKRFHKRIILTCVYVYCLLLVHRLTDSREGERLKREGQKQELQDRAKLLKAECASHPPPLTKPQKNAQAAAAVAPQLSVHYTKQHLRQALKDILYLPKHNISWCIVPKVASTSWSKALLELKGLTEDDLQHSDKSLQVILRDTYRSINLDQMNSTLRTSTKFLFARHPFERLVSAYRNKLEDSYLEADGSYFYNIYGRRIVEKYRVLDKNKKEKTGDNDENNPNEIKDELSDDVEFHKEPTFVEYVDYLVDSDVTTYDEHWKPIWLQCHVCDFTYDYVIKYENFKEEIELFISILKENGQLPDTFNLQWENRGGTNLNITRDYLKQISDQKLWKLYEKYRHDFGYFGYTMEDYVHL